MKPDSRAQDTKRWPGLRNHGDRFWLVNRSSHTGPKSIAGYRSAYKHILPRLSSTCHVNVPQSSLCSFELSSSIAIHIAVAYHLAMYCAIECGSESRFFLFTNRKIVQDLLVGRDFCLVGCDSTVTYRINFFLILLFYTIWRNVSLNRSAENRLKNANSVHGEIIERKQNNES